jgi:hypothetical protein
LSNRPKQRKASDWLNASEFVDANLASIFLFEKMILFASFSLDFCLKIHLKIPKTIKSDEKLFAHYLRSSVNSWEFEEVFKLRVHKIEF